MRYRSIIEGNLEEGEELGRDGPLTWTRFFTMLGRVVAALVAGVIIVLLVRLIGFLIWVL